MIALWIAAGLVAAAAFALIAGLSGRPVLAMADAARSVYRRQLSEIDDLAERGLLGEDERVAAHAEAARRLLREADPEVETPPAPKARTVAIAVGGMVAVLALGLYLAAGRPSATDEPYTHRLAQWKQSDPNQLQPDQMEALVKSALKERPNDATGLFYLGQVQQAQNNYPAAARSLERSLGVDPSNAEAWDLLGQVRVSQAKGKVSPEAREAFQKAVALNPKSLTSRYFLAHGDIDDGKVDQGVAELKALLPDSPEGARAVLERDIVAAQGQTPAPGGMADASANPAIMGMVKGLAQRLKDSPDDPAGWQRLVRSYAVLKDQAALNKALADARAYFKNRPADLAAIEQAAKVSAP